MPIRGYTGRPSSRTRMKGRSSEQPDRRDGCREREDEPHHVRSAAALCRTKGGENPAARADEKFADEKRK